MREELGGGSVENDNYLNRLNYFHLLHHFLQGITLVEPLANYYLCVWISLTVEKKLLPEVLQRY